LNVSTQKKIEVETSDHYKNGAIPKSQTSRDIQKQNKMVIFFSWITFSFVAGIIGSGRRIGFWGAFLLSIFLSPLVGLIFALVSKSKEKEEYEKRMLEIQKSQQEALKKLSQEKQNNASTLDLLVGDYQQVY
jgi:predicted histidine transporter YuiF (NhaC family)